MTKKPTCLVEIVELYLVENGFDGLCNLDGECACEVGELFLCDMPASDCLPGYKNPCDCGEHDWHISTTKP